MDSEKRESITEKIITEKTENIDEVQKELEDLDEMHKRALALAYARFLESHNITPEDVEEAAEPEVENIDEPEATVEAETSEEPETEEDVKEKPQKRVKKSRAISKLIAESYSPVISEEEQEKISAALEKNSDSANSIGRITDVYDNVVDKIEALFVSLTQQTIIGWHNITSTYRNSRRGIGLALLAVGILASVILVIFDSFTVYEYAYNGKVLGYVKEQEDVTDVLEIAGKRLSQNSGNGAEIKFVANQNVTFKLLQSKGKSIDDADIAVNKLVYMTDIEAEAYGVFDGNKMVAVVKSSNDADELLNRTKAALSQPDQGMELVSSEFINDLSVKQINVLLTSIQTDQDAMDTMVNGGSIEIYHIAEEGETTQSIAETFGVDGANVFNETNTEVVEEVSQGDTVCVHIEVEPVAVQMVETGKMKEIIEYETIKKESADYYQGDTHLEQEGVDGVQIFTGTITKVAGTVTEREESEPIEVLTKKQDKIILVGTTERPKTAPTGTYIVPLDHHEGVTSNFGYRWGRLHAGVDLGASRGEPIHAADGGKVIYASWWYGGGLTIEVEHNNGTYTKYEHCSKILVNVGDLVYQGQTIGLVGNTGNSFGNHLHFEIHPNGGGPVNPRPYLGI